MYPISPNWGTGDLGEGMCDDHIHERDIVSYRPLGSAPDLPKEVLDNINREKRHLINLAKAVTSGCCYEKLARQEIGEATTVRPVKNTPSLHSGRGRGVSQVC